MAAEAAQANPLLLLQQRVVVTAQSLTDCLQAALMSVMPRHLSLCRPTRSRQHRENASFPLDVVSRVRLHVPCTVAEESFRNKPTEIVLMEAARRER